LHKSEKKLWQIRLFELVLWIVLKSCFNELIFNLLYPCRLQGTFNNNLDFLTHDYLILPRGQQTLTLLYTISIVQPHPHTNR
jgi:hypothetical protein